MTDPTAETAVQSLTGWEYADGVRRVLRVAADLQPWEVDQLVEGWANQAQRLPVEQVGAWAQVGVLDPSDAVGLHTHGVQPDEVHTYGLARQIANQQLPINEAARLLLRLRGPAGARQVRDETAQREGLERARAQRDEYFRRHRQAGTLRGAATADPAWISNQLIAWGEPDVTDRLVDDIAAELASMDQRRASALVQLIEMDEQVASSMGHRRPSPPERLAAELFYEHLPVSGMPPDSLEVASIAQAAIHAYTTELPNTPFGADTTAAAATALARVGQTLTSHASPHTVQAIGTAAISLYSGYTSDPDQLAPALAWEQTLSDILDAWSPPAHDRPPPHRIEPVDQLIGTHAERADLEIAHSEVASPDGGGRWAQQLHPLVKDALQQQTVAVPTVVLREQLSDVIDMLDRRPADRTAQHDWVARQLASLHQQHHQLTTLLAGTPLDQPLHDAPGRLQGLAQQITQITGTVAMLSQQLAARAAWDHQHLTTLARAEQLTTELSHRETMAIQRLAADPPAYLHNTLGTPPTHSSTARQAWLDAAQVIARYRIDTGVSDPSDPFGPASTDPDKQADRQAAIQQVAQLRRALDRSPHRDRALMEHRQEPPGPSPLGLP